MTMPSILFVDDEPNILSGLRRALRGNNDKWDMHFVTSGKAALDIIEKQPVNLVVTDMRMPGMDGAELLEIISQNAPQIIRFALSGESDVAQAIRIAGRSHRFLAKPTEPEVLLGVINSLFGDDALLDRYCDASISAFDNLVCAHDQFDALKDLLKEPDRNSAAIAARIMFDPSLSVRMLQLCNSAYFGKPLKTASIQRAVSYVGTSRLARLLNEGRLGREFAAGSDGADDHVLRAMAAVISRERLAAAGASELVQDIAYATALFSGLGQAGAAEPNCASKPICIATLFGLPDPLVESLKLFGEAKDMPQGEDAIATLAIETTKRAISHIKEAA